MCIRDRLYARLRQRLDAAFDLQFVAGRRADAGGTDGCVKDDAAAQIDAERVLPARFDTFHDLGQDRVAAAEYVARDLHRVPHPQGGGDLIPDGRADLDRHKLPPQIRLRGSDAPDGV